MPWVVVALCFQRGRTGAISGPNSFDLMAVDGQPMCMKAEAMAMPAASDVASEERDAERSPSLQMLMPQMQPPPMWR